MCKGEENKTLSIKHTVKYFWRELFDKTILLRENANLLKKKKPKTNYQTETSMEYRLLKEIHVNPHWLVKYCFS